MQRLHRLRPHRRLHDPLEPALLDLRLRRRRTAAHQRQLLGNNPFDDEDISREELGKYGIEHLSRMSGNNAGGQLDAKIATTDTLLQAFDSTLTRETGKTPGQRPDTSRLRTKEALAPMDQPASGVHAYHAPDHQRHHHSHHGLRAVHHDRLRPLRNAR